MRRYIYSVEMYYNNEYIIGIYGLQYEFLILLCFTYILYSIRRTVNIYRPCFDLKRNVKGHKNLNAQNMYTFYYTSQQ